MSSPSPARASLSIHVRLADRAEFLDAADTLILQKPLRVLTTHTFAVGERLKLLLGYSSPSSSVNLQVEVHSVSAPNAEGDLHLHVKLTPDRPGDVALLQRLVAEGRATRTFRILLTEDNLHIRQMYTRALHQSFDDGEASASVEFAGDGLEALHLLERNGPPDLILTDLAMPVMDGLAFVARLRSDPRYRAIPVLVISGQDERAMDHAAALGIQGQLHKPVQLTHIVEQVRRILGLPPRSA